MNYGPTSRNRALTKKITGRKYYCEELDVTYHITRKNANALSIYIGSKELLTLRPVMENVFNEEHFGYVKFGYGDEGSIDHFTINDELAKNILFTKIPNS